MDEKPPPLFEMIAKGLDDFSKTAHKIATILETIEKIGSSTQGQPEPSGTETTLLFEPNVKPKTGKKSIKPQNAADQILAIIKSAETDVSAQEVIQQVGLDDKKVYNIIHHLIRNGQIKRVARGKYSVPI